MPPGGAEGVLLAQGSLLGGWSLYVQDGRLRYVHNFVGMEEHRVVRSDAPIAPGAHVARLPLHAAPASTAGTVALARRRRGRRARVRSPRFTPTRFSITGAGLTCGRGNGLAVTDDYSGAFPFTGTLRRVVVDVDGAPFSDPDGEATLAIATQ